MRVVQFILPLVLAAFLSSSVLAADKEVNVKGTLAEKAADAKAGVVAVLVERAPKAEPPQTKKYDLVATGDVATKLTTLATAKARVEVTGVETDNTIKVTDVKEIEGVARQ